MNHQQDIVRSFQTIVEMFADRGAAYAGSQLGGLVGEDVLALAGSRLTFHIDDPPTGHRVIYELSPKFKLSNIRKLIDPPPEGLRAFLVVVRDMPTAAALKSMDELGVSIEFFDVRELQYNVSRHVLVPRHEPIRDEEAVAALVRAHSLKTRFQFPIILATDPMARYLALRHGQLVRITRPSPSAGTYTLYRCCLKSS